MYRSLPDTPALHREGMYSQDLSALLTSASSAHYLVGGVIAVHMLDGAGLSHKLSE
jgi:hypothetical protein